MTERGDGEHDRDECPHPEHGEPTIPDTMETVYDRCQAAAKDSAESDERPRIVRAAGYVTRKGALVVGHYSEGYLRAYFIHSLN